MPDKIANAPELLMGLELYYIAFSDLTSCRGSPDSQINWVAIKQWAEEHELYGEQREDLFFHVQSLDSVFLDYKVKRAKRQTGANNGKKL